MREILLFEPVMITQTFKGAAKVNEAVFDAFAVESALN